MIRSAFNFKPQGLKKIKLSAQGALTFKICEMKLGLLLVSVCENFLFCFVGYEGIAETRKQLA